ncbi:MAG TPA: S-methyl-5-thioribose-1-phosphate isomerase, partial [Bacteroidota bacterium]|nr:S-methyl-5-thioribose-1-phosphate isomerase [Bacteroidota bacterium]
MVPIDWRDGKVRFLDQTRLPAEEITIETGDYHVVAGAIRTLRIRGAPLIGIAAGYAVALAASTPGIGAGAVTTGATPAARAALAIDELARTRPTAVNLF